MVKQLHQSMFNSTAMVKFMLAVVLSLFLLRLASLGMYPLFDTTEARYGEIARIMFETQNWVTPQFDYGVPFWGKPPFHTWISAASFSIFGVSEFFARLPHLLVGILTATVVYRFVATVADTHRAVMSLFILASTLGFILAIGMVMTDSSLLLAYTLAMTSFWLRYTGHHSKLNGHLFFAALALGMLVKGPVAVALVVIALTVWSVSQKQFVNAISSLPWKTGFPLFWMLVIPWYVWAELRTPGFIEYFVVGEHIQRFLVSGWEGDLYGSAHDRPRGTIWIYWVLCAFPWSFFVIKALFNSIKNRNKAKCVGSENQDPEEMQSPIHAYSLAWIFAPVILFTFAGNVLPIYVMPGFGAMAVFVAVTHTLSKRFTAAGSLTFALLVVLIVLVTSGKISLLTEQKLLANQMETIQSDKLYYWHKRPFSAQFYSQGQAKLLTDSAVLEAMMREKAVFYLVINQTKFADVAKLLNNHCVVSKVVDKRSLFKCH